MDFGTIGKGDMVGLVIVPVLGAAAAPLLSKNSAALERNSAVERSFFVGLCHDSGAIEQTCTASELARQIAKIEQSAQPRWVWWSNVTAAALIAVDVRVAKCWDLRAVHRLLWGGWSVTEGEIWSSAKGLDVRPVPKAGQFDLTGGDPVEQNIGPIRADGHLGDDWALGAWRDSPRNCAIWAELGLRVAEAQLGQIATIVAGSQRSAVTMLATARSESAAEMLCAEMNVAGLPLSLETAESIIGSFAGPRPQSDSEDAAIRQRRDDEVLRHLPPGHSGDLRNPAQVKRMLRSVGVEVENTRAHQLERFRAHHPFVDALLTWRKAERVATTFGYGWVDANVGPDGRLRGEWSGSDGAAGRMTATVGLHNLPADLRPAILADPGWCFVRADLGQIEPRVLAAVSGDQALAAATQADDLYAPIASRLGVERAVAKIAVLAAMYGQTSGAAGEALRGMESAYPVAMTFLRLADQQGREGKHLRTYGGRLVRMWADDPASSETDRWKGAAARGRFARNAMVQGAAAEFFKTWAVTLRARISDPGTSIVLCLHDELLVHTPVEAAETTKSELVRSLDEAAFRWHPKGDVRFVADASVIKSWAEAKG